MLFHAFHHTLPAAYALLPPAMRSDAATAMLLAIALQESDFQERRQLENGPARGFFQFERGGGVRGVMTHRASAPHLARVLQVLRYQPDEHALHAAIEHNDVLACVFARLLLWTLPGSLPGPHHYEVGWRQYLAGWRPGKPHPAKWPGVFGVAWDIVQPEGPTS